MSLRVIHLIARMNNGGTAVYLNNLLPGLQDKNVETLLLFGRVSDNETEAKIHFPNAIQIPSLGREIDLIQDFNAIRQIRNQIRSFEPDLIHSHTFKAGLLGYCINSPAKLIHTFHGHHLYDPNFKGVKGKILNSVERHISHRRCAHIAIGERVKRELLNVGVGSEDKFESIPPGIPEDTAADKEESQSKIGITPSKQFTVTWLGRFTAVKNPSLVNQIARKLPSVRFVMGGHGELFDQVKREAPANVYFVGWQDSKDLISASDVIISTSHSEGMPLALIESQMLGKPIISTNVGSVSEIVIDNTTGFLVPRDAESFAQKIDLIQTSPNLAEKFSSEGKIYARKHFKSSQLVNRHIELYSRVSNSI